jgi:hypothetical protein
MEAQDEPEHDNHSNKTRAYVPVSDKHPFCFESFGQIDDFWRRKSAMIYIALP